MESQNTNLPKHPSIKPRQSRITRKRTQYNNSIYNKGNMNKFKNADLDTIDITLNSLIKKYKISKSKRRKKELEKKIKILKKIKEDKIKSLPFKKRMEYKFNRLIGNKTRKTNILGNNRSTSTMRQRLARTLRSLRPAQSVTVYSPNESIAIGRSRQPVTI